MPVFQYTALDAKGNEVKAEIEALSSKEAISKIRSKGLFPTKVQAQGAAKKAKAAEAAAPRRRRSGGKVKSKKVMQFARQLATLQDAGLAILRSLRILQEQEKSGTLKRVIGYVADDIEGGSTLSEAMAIPYSRASRSSSSWSSWWGSTLTPPLEPPKGSPAAEHLTVIQPDRAMISSREASR
mgnify:CR=1 FL=1